MPQSRGHTGPTGHGANDVARSSAKRELRYARNPPGTLDFGPTADFAILGLEASTELSERVGVHPTRPRLGDPEVARNRVERAPFEVVLANDPPLSCRKRGERRKQALNALLGEKRLLGGSTGKRALEWALGEKPCAHAGKGAFER